MADDLLDCLLSVATEEIPGPLKSKTAPRDPFGDTLNALDNCTETVKNKSTLSDTAKLQRLSTIHSGDTDSSDDEDNRDFENRKYNESGKNIKHLLDGSEQPKLLQEASKLEIKKTWSTKAALKEYTQPQPSASPILGIRVINPLVSSKVLEDRLVGREIIPMAKMKMFVRNVSAGKDWVVAGVIVSKSATRTSQKGKNYCIWTLSDLKNDLKRVAVFLFGSAYKESWKTVPGTVVGILNPSVLELRNGSKDEACLSVDNHQRVMIIGQSKDLGTCRSTRKDGDRCTAFVNKNTCEFCLYHVKQEYQKCSKRSELQSNFAGRGLTALRNKVLGKNQVFYAGKIYSAIPAGKNKKQMKKDEGRLRSLDGFVTSIKAPVRNPKKKQAARLELAAGQRRRDLERLRQLGVNSELNFDEKAKVNFKGQLSRDVCVEESKNLALDVIGKLKESKNETLKINESGNGDHTEKLNGSGDEELNEEEFRMQIKSFLGKLKKIKNESENGGGSDVGESEIDDFRREVQNLELKDDDDIFYSNAIIKYKIMDVGSDYDSAEDTSSSIENDFDFKIDCKKLRSARTSLFNAAKTQERLSVQEPTKQKENVNFGCSKTIQTPNLDINATSTQSLTNTPFLSGFGKSQIDLSAPIKQKHSNRAKQNAVTWVQNNGPIKKQDPNNTKGKKRALEALNNLNPIENPKKSKIDENEFFSERFKKMMAATSNHTDLLERRDEEEQEKYFNKLEMKERMEEKMSTTYKVPCKAVRCLQCKYTNFSASDLCKAEKHPLRVFDATKRFFKCSNCGNRTACLSLVPTNCCKNCGSFKWERTGMMKERKVEIAAPSLSIRGGEQKFVNSVIGGANLDLLVPDE